jgi:hypothetical protein
MHQRKLMVGFLLAVFAIASATLITTVRINGTGRLADAAGHFGYFTVDANKITHDGISSLRGTFDFYVPGPNSLDNLRVHLNTVEGMNVTENKGAIGGPGVLRIQRGTEVHYYFGRVYFLATSNRHLGEAGPLDAGAVHFFPNVITDPSYHLEGVVTDGDVEVSTNLSY